MRSSTGTPASELPVLNDVQVLRRLAALGFLVGAALDLLSMVLPDPDTRDHEHMLFVAAVPFVLGTVLLVGRRLSARAIRLIAITGGILTISILVAVIMPLGAALMFYCWPALTIGYFCTGREFWGNLALLAATSAVALALSRSTEITGSTWAVTVSIAAIVAIGVAGLVRRNDDLMARLHDVATTDALTGLLNRAAFEPILEREVSRAREVAAPLSVVLFDLDHFKDVNDRHGHAAGDAALKRFGALLAAETRDIDVAARTGGEEFTVLLVGADTAAARAWAAGVSALLIADTLDEPVPLSTSAGIATLERTDATADDLLLAADRALYAAKDAGRRQVVVATPEQHARLRRVA